MSQPNIEQQTTENIIPALVENATPLGLKWELRPGTVISNEGGSTIIRYDGESDDTNSRATSMVGAVSPGSRIMVMYVPPAGNYIVGVLSTQWKLAEKINIQPPAGAASEAIVFNEGYTVFVDNAGAGTDASRWWLDGPDGGEVVIGPRSGSEFFDSIRLRTDATTASAANCFIDASSQTIRRSTSSARYKTDIRDLDLDLAAILKLRGVRFKDKTQVAELGNRAPDHIGFIAEEVTELGLNEFVHFTEDGQPDGVQYDRLVVFLLELARAQDERIRRLEQRHL